jgi:tRNA (mo5U34)-methyltransferase
VWSADILSAVGLGTFSPPPFKGKCIAGQDVRHPTACNMHALRKHSDSTRFAADFFRARIRRGVAGTPEIPGCHPGNHRYTPRDREEKSNSSRQRPSKQIQQHPIMSASRDELKKRANNVTWFHAIDFGDFQSSGRFPENMPQNCTLFPAFDLLKDIDVSGMDCLDVGSAHGLVSFGLKKAGARRVAAVDVMKQPSPGFTVARELLDLEVDYYYDTPIARMNEKLEGQRFDLIVCAGVIYHMLNPFEAFMNCRRLLKPNGLFLLESAYLPGDEQAKMMFNSESFTLQEVYTYWIPTASCIAGMMKLSYYNVLASRSIAKPDRIAFLGRAVTADKVENRTQICKRIHETGLQDPAFPKESELEGCEPSEIKYSGEVGGTQQMDVHSYDPVFPFHPVKLTNPVGTSCWIGKNKNY